MNTQSFIAAAHVARRALLGRRAQSNVTGREGTITDGSISMYGFREIAHTLRLTTAEGDEWLTMDRLVFLDDGVTIEPPALTDGQLLKENRLAQSEKVFFLKPFLDEGANGEPPALTDGKTKQ
mgnify:FL=1